MTVGLAAAGLLTAGCTPQNTADKIISGTIMGSDGKIVDVMLGFDVVDSAGHKIDLGGGKAGYSAIQRLNHCVPASGAASSQTCPNTGYVTGYNWSLKVPYNVQTVYIEVYPKAANSFDWLNTPTYVGPAAGTTDTSTYSLTYKRALPLPSSKSGVKIVLPKTCGVAGAQTGSLAGSIAGWPLGKTGTVNAWSNAANTLDTQGFGLGVVDATGHYRINGLMAGQRYGLIAAGPGFSRNVVNYTNATTNATLVPSACAVKTYNF
jgi:hypothetical protein